MGKVSHKHEIERKVSHKNMEDYWKFAINPKRIKGKVRHTGKIECKVSHKHIKDYGQG